MKKLEKFIENNCVQNVEEMKQTVVDMVCEDDAYLPLSAEEVLRVLECKGEFFVLKLSYEELQQELQEKKIVPKLANSLCVTISFEEDGEHYEDIENFLQYVKKHLDEQQNFIFGIRRVDKTSPFAIKILFSGILPINQLVMTMGEALYDRLYGEGNNFKEKFKHYRAMVSQEIGMPLLPLLPKIDNSLDDFEVKLVDPLEGKTIAAFDLKEDVNEKTIDIYLLKLFNIYKKLAK